MLLLHVYIKCNRTGTTYFASRPSGREDQDSSKEGAVETGCSDLYDVIYDFIIEYYPNPLHPPPTAPPFDEYPEERRAPGVLAHR